VSGTGDPINPFSGGEVHPPGGGALGTVLSAEDTARYFRTLDAAPKKASVERYPDRDPRDGTEVEMLRWIGEEHEVALMVVHGGGHSLPQPVVRFPEPVVGPVSRDLDGAVAIWRFFHRQMAGN
jgi:polyhydroxybutyrate depolymerase